MSETIEGKARQTALDDWAAQRVRHLVVGLLRTDRPLLGDGLLYVGTVGCEASDENLRFCAAYNEAVAQLVREQGEPAWAPSPRVPARKAALERLAAGAGLAGLIFKNHTEEMAFNTLLYRWRGATEGQPRLWCRDEEKGLLLLGGDWSSAVGRVDVIDGWQGRWMASYEYLRKHVPHFPWDDGAAQR